MATNLPPLIGKPSKRQESVANWTTLGLWIASVSVPLALQLKELFSKKPAAPAAKE